MNKEILTIGRTRALLAEKKLSCGELVREKLAVIKEWEDGIHAFLSVFEEDAFLEADRVDKKIADGEPLGPLEGVPIALKDNMLKVGTKTTAASRILENYTASYDAFVVSKLKDAGAVFLGKTNMDEFAMGSSCENSAYGITKNPHDAERVPGGSSGGSAAAVAAGECVAALGSDTGGSIRQPAAFCGVVGLKPTYGAVSRSGLIAMASSLDQIGPITRTVKDAEILFGAIRGKDPKDATSLVLPDDSFQKRGGWVVGIPKEYFGSGIDSEVKSLVKRAISALEDSGVKTKEIALPHTPYALACYYIIMPAEASSNLARFEGVRYGLHEEDKTLLGEYKRSRSKGFGREVRRRIILGTYVLSSGYYDAYYLSAQKVRTLVKQDFAEAFKTVDVILTPTTPTPAFKIGEKTADPLKMYLSDALTVPVNLAGLPAISIPCGKAGNLPVGLQLIAPAFRENMLFTLGKQYEEIRDAA